MKKLGCGVAILGVLVFAAGVKLWVPVLDANRVAAVLLVPGEKKTTDTFKVSTKELCQIGVYLDLTTKSFKVLDPGDYVAHYRFPVGYTVLNAEGATVFSEDSSAGHWSLSELREASEEPLDERGGKVSVLSLLLDEPPLVRLRVEHRFAAFKVPPPGDITIEIEVGPDTKYKVTVSKAELRVYDNAARGGSLGVALLVVGGLLGVTSIGLFVAGFGRKARDRSRLHPT